MWLRPQSVGRAAAAGVGVGSTRTPVSSAGQHTCAFERFSLDDYRKGTAPAASDETMALNVDGQAKWRSANVAADGGHSPNGRHRPKPTSADPQRRGASAAPPGNTSEPAWGAIPK